MTTRSKLARLGAGVVLTAATTVLLRRVRTDFERDYRLRPGTAVMVYTAYAVQLAAMTELMAFPTSRLPIPPRACRVLGGALALAGAGTFVAGASSFGSTRQLSGTETGRLVDGGIYRWSRNPQYLGYLGVLAGASLARRSTDATLATAASAAIFNHWIGHEEANLTELFGDAYRHYRNHTSRWFGAPARA